MHYIFTTVSKLIRQQLIPFIRSTEPVSWNTRLKFLSDIASLKFDYFVSISNNFTISIS